MDFGTGANARFKNDLHVPDVKPYSNDTWEASLSLSGSEITSEREAIIFPCPARIVGIYPSIIRNSSDDNALIQPTLDDIMVLMDMNQQRRYTSNVGQTSRATHGSGFVTLASLDTRVRDLNIVVDTPRPEQGFQLRWKRFIQGTPLYRSVIVSLSMMVEIDD